MAIGSRECAESSTKANSLGKMKNNLFKKVPSFQESHMFLLVHCIHDSRSSVT